MIRLRKMLRRLRALAFRRRLERELDDELRFHLEMETDKRRREGLADREARRRARLAFGSIERFREETRDARGVRPLEDLARDLRLGARVLIERPGFTLVVLAILGLGVGGSAAIFGAVDGILLTPLPYPDPNRLVAVWEHDRVSGDDRIEVAPANFLDWRERSDAFEHLVSAEPYGFDWRRPEGAVPLQAWLVSEHFFETAGVPAFLGRTFRADEHFEGKAAVVVLGYDLWRTTFAADLDVVGRVLDLEGSPYEVIGVMPEGFALPDDGAVWAPKLWQGWEAESRTSNFYSAYGRLGAGVTLEQGQAEMDAIAAQLAGEHPGSNAAAGVALVPMAEQLLGRVRRALLLLLAAVGMFLLVVTANVASMQLARAAGRTREFALRGALGAGRFRVARELLVENLLLGTAGAVLGFGVAYLALGALRSLAPSGVPRVHELQADGDVLLFAILVSLGAVLATGLLPTAIAARTRLSTSLFEGGRTSSGGRWIGRVQAGLVVCQLGLSVMLLIGAGLLVRSFVSLLGEDRGFRTEGVVAGAVHAWDYPAVDRVAFTSRVIERLQSSTGVAAAGMTSSLPLLEAIGADQGDLAFPEQPLGPDESAPRVHYSGVTPGYFEVMGIPLLRGRLLDSRDGPADLPVALVDEAFVEQYWGPGVEPLGRRFALSSQGPPLAREVVGVVGNVRGEALHLRPRPTVYIPHAQYPTGANVFVVLGRSAPENLLDLLARTVADANPLLPVSRAISLPDLVGGSVQERRFLMALLSGFAALALGLAAAGIFGLMSYTIAERTREIGVRIALGADRRTVVTMILRSSGALAAAGIGLGVLAARGLTRVLEGMLYAVDPLDPVTFVAGAVVLLLTALAASAVPALRAARTDPVRALQAE